MFSKLLPGLNNKEIILASASPRREEILKKLKLPFKVVTSKFAEDLDKSLYFGRPGDYVIDNASFKAEDVASQLSNQCLKICLFPYIQHFTLDTVKLVIGCDTVVVFGGKIYEKPVDKNDAIRMLHDFSGREHSVYTGVVFLEVHGLKKKFAEKFCEVTKLQFGDLSSELIDAYVESGESFDKAGAYSIQDSAAALVRAIDGDFYNVMGFPLHRVLSSLLSLYGRP
ncbi:N-acetylserotonin O-methyltransferase-like protein [Trichinella papuae]|uniref:N-acetylserotonin O-methyltransferase-like protein n=1 Tax=Trichinella papuae TaxID=268474 RepID=A0A0V1N063_9BILA|nr:N-acetylserotonin O-methyltransferase-like protein [Trichinella papuae]